MAQIINIAGAQAIDDPEYRYKMPRIIERTAKKMSPEGRARALTEFDMPDALARHFRQ